MRITISLIAGLLFGLGLVIGGMANPAKVQNFLDVFGTFDPSLAFVMAGALVVTFVGYRIAFRRPTPLYAEQFHLPTATELDRRLVIGPALFGVGWGLSGFCPGPAITSLSLMAPGTLIFVTAMLAGIGLARLVSKNASHTRLEANEGKA
ncbi:MAG: YeeE/YedE family protein [Methyloceanibacter sp.]|nr:YeeE/YedE family protein [Methyloceanibacter sp.]